MVNYSLSVTALLSVVSLLGADASARVKNGHDAGGKEHRRKLVGYSEKIVEDWTDDGWHADGWEKPILCEKPETWSAPQWKINTKKTLATIDQWEEPEWNPPAPKWDAPSEPEWGPAGWSDASSGVTHLQLRGSKSGSKSGKVGKASSASSYGNKGGKSGGEAMTEYSEEGGWSTGTEWNRASTWAGGGRRLVSSWSTEEVKSPVMHWDVPSSTMTKAGKSEEGNSEKNSKGDKSTSNGSWPSPASSWKSSGWKKGPKSMSYGSWPSPASSWKSSGWKGSAAPSICQPAQTEAPAPSQPVALTSCAERKWYYDKGQCTNDNEQPGEHDTFKECCEINFASTGDCVFEDICNPNEVLTLPPSDFPTYSPTVTPTIEPTSPPTRKPTTEPSEPFIEVLPTPPPSDSPTACPPPTPGVPSMPGCPTPEPTAPPVVEVLPTPPPSDSPTACPPPTPGVPSMPGCPTPEPTAPPVVEVLPTPPPSDSPTACPPPTPGVPSMPGCSTPEPTAPPVVEVLPTPPPSFGIDTYSPTFGSTPTVSKETTGPPTSARRTRTFEEDKTDCVNNYDTVVSAESSSTVEVCVYVCTTTKTKYEGGVPVDTEVKTTHAACP